MNGQSVGDQRCPCKSSLRSPASAPRRGPWDLHGPLGAAAKKSIGSDVPRSVRHLFARVGCCATTRQSNCLPPAPHARAQSRGQTRPPSAAEHSIVPQVVNTANKVGRAANSIASHLASGQSPQARNPAPLRLRPRARGSANRPRNGAAGGSTGCGQSRRVRRCRSHVAVSLR